MDYIDTVHSNLVLQGLTSTDATKAIDYFRLREKIKDCEHIQFHLDPKLVAKLVLDSYKNI